MPWLAMPRLGGLLNWAEQSWTGTCEGGLSPRQTVAGQGRGLPLPPQVWLHLTQPRLPRPALSSNGSSGFQTAVSTVQQRKTLRRFLQKTDAHGALTLFGYLSKKQSLSKQLTPGCVGVPRKSSPSSQKQSTAHREKITEIINLDVLLRAKVYQTHYTGTALRYIYIYIYL